MRNHPYILMLEDDPDDRTLTHSIIEESGISVPLIFLSSYTELEAALEINPPILILLDYNLNPETGLDVLKKLKSDKKFLHIPVVILGDTEDPGFTAECYRMGANSYIIKPSSIEETKKKITLFFKYWLEVAELNGKTSLVLFQ
jgi:CheY-like chemotaxis protein